VSKQPAPLTLLSLSMFPSSPRTANHTQVDDLEFTLNEAELASGLALLCMARPAPDTPTGTVIDIETQSDYGYSLGSAEWNGATGRIEGGVPTRLMGEA